MIDQAVTADTPPPPDAPRVPALEERVRHLEEMVTALQDTRALEERVAERVAARVGAAPPDGVRPAAGLLVEAGRHLLPAAAGALAAGAVAAEAHARAQAQPAAPARQPWLLFDVFAEFRALLRMYLDRRYRRTWQAWLLPPLLLAAIATSWFWLPGTGVLDKISAGILGTLFDKAVDVVLAFVLWKVLHREVSRYRATSPDLPPSLRL